MSRKILPALLLLVLTACAVLGGPPYVPGVTTRSEVLARNGPPALARDEAGTEARGGGGVQRLYWPSGPAGTSTLMARFDDKQRLLSIEEVLDMPHFSKIRAGMSMDDVLYEIGPPYPGWTTYFKARDELVWEWRYCDDWGSAARFNVMFDGASKKVRSTLSLTESQRFSFRRADPPCGQTYIPLAPAPAPAPAAAAPAPSR